MSGSLDRRAFLKSTAAAGAAIGLGTAAGPALLAAEVGEPLFKISLAEWSLHRTLFDKKLDNLDFPAFAKNEFGIEAVEYVNQFFKDKAKDNDYLTDLKKRADDQRRHERAHHERRRGLARRSGRARSHGGGREPLQVGRGGQVPGLPFDPRQRPLGR